MALNQPILIDDVALNGASGIEVWITPGDPYQLSEETRSRANFYPALDNASNNARRLPILVKRSVGAAATMTTAEFDSHVRGIFRVSSRERVLTSERDGIQYSIGARVTAFDRRQGGGAWDGQILLLDPEWKGPLVGPFTASPLDVAGNIDARPVIRVTDGASALRRRITLRDRTDEAIASWPLPVDVSLDGLASSNYTVYMNGFPQPYWLVDGWLYVRVAANALDPTWIDILASAAIDNTVDDRTNGSAYDAAGTLLDPALASGTAVADPASPMSHPKSSALAWFPGVGGKHSDGRGYTFGFNGDGALELVDTERTGETRQLDNDADSYILATPVAAETLSNVKIEAFAGYRAGKASAREGGVRVLKVMIGDANGNVHSGPTLDDSYPLYAAGTRHPDYEWYAQFTFGQITFPHTRVTREFVDERQVELGQIYYTHQRWSDDYLPYEFGDLAAKHIGCPVTSGGTGVWYLWFDEDAYNGGAIPDLSMSIQPKSGQFVAKTILNPPAIFKQEILGNAALDNVLAMTTQWVDPVTLQPLGVETDTTPEQDQFGLGKVFVAYWLRESETPLIAFERTIRGGKTPASVPAQASTVITAVDGGLLYTITPPEIAIPGAVKVAIGVAPASATPNTIDWITMRLAEPVTITLDSDELPSLTEVDVAGQHLDGTLLNHASGESIRLNNVYSDANGLEIDCERLDIGGVGGVGMVYGQIHPTGQLRWFDLPVGDVEWEVVGDAATATWSFEYSPHLIGNS